MDATKVTAPTIALRIIPGVQPIQHIRRLNKIDSRRMTAINTFGSNPDRYTLLMTDEICKTNMRDLIS